MRLQSTVMSFKETKAKNKNWEMENYRATDGRDERQPTIHIQEKEAKEYKK